MNAGPEVQNRPSDAAGLGLIRVRSPITADHPRPRLGACRPESTSTLA